MSHMERVGVRELRRQASAILRRVAAGETIFRASCAGCHGSSGQGSIGPKLADGAVVAKFPKAADEVAVVSNGRGGMPAWSSRLTPAQIDAVVRYTREGL